MKRNKFFAILLCLACAALLFGCEVRPAQPSTPASILEKSSNGLMSLKKSGYGLKYYSSDEGFDFFLNDYYSRHIRDNTDKAIGTVKQGMGGSSSERGFWTGIDGKYIPWYNATEEGVNGYSPLDNYAAQLDAYDLTVYGSVNDAAYVTAFTDMLGSGDRKMNFSGGLGWPFISGQQTGNYAIDFITPYATGWTVDGHPAGDEEKGGGKIASGFWTYRHTGTDNLVYEFTPENPLSLSYAPLIELCFKLKDLSTSGGYYPHIKDITVSFSLQDDEEWHTMSYYKDAMYNNAITSNTMIRSWFPAYLYECWTTESYLDGLKIEFVPDDGTKLDIEVAMNYICLQTDTRHTTNNSYYVISMEDYVSWTGDTEMLSRHLDDVRRATLFQIEALDGKSGLLKTDYIWGKKTSIVAQNKFGLQGNGWSDCVPTGTVNFEANLTFYDALLSMARLEEYAEAAGVECGTSKIRNPHPFSGNDDYIEYTYDAQSLRELAQKVRDTVRKDYDEGGLWNPATGRFAWAIYDENSAGGKQGEPMDYGHTEFNLTAVYNGMASEEQAESIMSWISGKRTVEGDDSQGEDIYFYEFAPRFATKSNYGTNGTVGGGADTSSGVNKGKFGFDIQNGGASMHVSYHDLLARHAYYGSDNAFGRYKEIQAWYEKVLAAGGKGMDFYRQYYALMTYEYGNEYRMSGNGAGINGSIGLDYEFFEAALLYAAVPPIFFGLDAEYNTLLISPDVPSALSYMAMENLMFSGVKYDLYVTNSSAVISGVRGGNTAGKTVKLTFRADEGATVYVNYAPVQNVERGEGTVTVEVPLGQCTVEVK